MLPGNSNGAEGGMGGASSGSGNGATSAALYALKLRKTEAERGRRHNLGGLLSSDFESLLSSPRKAGIDATTLNWTGASLLRGELMVKVIFSVVHCYVRVLGGEAWRSIYSLLLWVRTRGGLPAPLATINDDWYENVAIMEPELTVTSSSSSSGSSGDGGVGGRNRDCSPSTVPALSTRSLQASLYALRCHAVSRGLVSATYFQPRQRRGKDDDDGSDDTDSAGGGGGNGGGGSLWMSVASLGGLLWSTQASSSGSHSGRSGNGLHISAARLAQSVPGPYDGNSSPYAAAMGPGPASKAGGSSSGGAGAAGAVTSQGGSATAGTVAENSQDRDLLPDDFLRLSITHSRAAEVLGPRGQIRGGVLDDRGLQDVVLSLLDLLSATLSNISSTAHKSISGRENLISTASSGSSSSSSAHRRTSHKADTVVDPNSRSSSDSNSSSSNGNSTSGHVSSSLTGLPFSPTSSDRKSHSWGAATSVTAVPSIPGSSELDAVMLLEWLAVILYANKLKLVYMWPKIHGERFVTCRRRIKHPIGIVFFILLLSILTIHH